MEMVFSLLFFEKRDADCSSCHGRQLPWMRRQNSGGGKRNEDI